MPALHPSVALDAPVVPRPSLHMQPALPAPARLGNARAALLIVAGLALVVVAMFLWWPAGVVIGLVLGVAVVLALGGAQQHAAVGTPVDADLADLFGGSVTIASADTEAPAAELALTATPLRAAVAAAAPQQERVFALPATQPAAVVAPAAAAPAAAVVAEAQIAAPAATPALAEAATSSARSGVRADLGRLKADLGDDWPDFARAARLVVSTQYASAARLQRDLQLPYSRARRLLAGLESEHFVGPATGTLPRQVLVQKERLPEVERLFAGV